MKVWAISDLHLPARSERRPQKMVEMGYRKAYPDLLASRWDASVSPEDVVIVPGDISWANRYGVFAKSDLEWLHARPGRRLIGRGNHGLGLVAR